VINLTWKLYEGMQHKWKERAQKEKDTVRTRYRGGNSGILMEDGTAVGECPKKALARYLGKYTDPDYDTQLMFDVGELNEDRWEDYLTRAGVDVKKADDAIKWHTDAGTPVTGSPDALIYEDGKPVMGIEHKHASSMNTARGVIGGEPQLKHLIQTAHYSMALDDLPFTLLYTSSTNIEGAEWKMKDANIPKPGQPRSEFCEYTYYKYTGQTRTYKTGKNKGKTIHLKQKVMTNFLEDSDLSPGEIMKKYDADFADLKYFRPFAIEFPTTWKEDTFYFYNGAKWIKTIITKDRIKAFYNELDRMQAAKDLGPVPYNLKPDGEPMPWPHENYCEMCQMSEKLNHKYDDWVNHLELEGDKG